MKIRAIAEEERTQDDKHFVGVAFKVRSRGQPVPSLTFGSVGVDTSAEDARRTAVDEWAILFAEQYCAAVAKTPDGLRVGPFVVYPGLLGLRGEHPGGWLKNESERNQRIVDAVVPQLLPMEPGEIGMVDVKVAVRDAGRPEGQCFVNASLASAACERITSLPWPPGTYLYKTGVRVQDWRLAGLIALTGQARLADVHRALRSLVWSAWVSGLNSKAYFGSAGAEPQAS